MIRAWLTKRREARAKEADAAERAAIAKAFNDRYCYREQFVANAERLPGTAIHGLLPRGGYRWMCPECNALQAPLECSVWSGLQYPECCSTFRGHRLSFGIRTS